MALRRAVNVPLLLDGLRNVFLTQQFDISSGDVVGGHTRDQRLTKARLETALPLRLCGVHHLSSDENFPLLDVICCELARDTVLRPDT
jgi:hypothetical protein